PDQSAGHDSSRGRPPPTIRSLPNPPHPGSPRFASKSDSDTDGCWDNRDWPAAEDKDPPHPTDSKATGPPPTTPTNSPLREDRPNRQFPSSRANAWRKVVRPIPIAASPNRTSTAPDTRSPFAVHRANAHRMRGSPAARREAACHRPAAPSRPPRPGPPHPIPATARLSPHECEPPATRVEPP